MTRNNNVIGRSVATDINTENCHSNSTHPRSVLNVIGVAPGASISAPIGLHFSKGVGQSRQTSVVLNLPCNKYVACLAGLLPFVTRTIFNLLISF
jgi:hypothetical protein